MRSAWSKSARRVTNEENCLSNLKRNLHQATLEEKIARENFQEAIMKEKNEKEQKKNTTVTNSQRSAGIERLEGKLARATQVSVCRLLRMTTYNYTDFDDPPGITISTYTGTGKVRTSCKACSKEIVRSI